MTSIINNAKKCSVEQPQTQRAAMANATWSIG